MKKVIVVLTLVLFCLTANKMYAQCADQFETGHEVEYALADGSSLMSEMNEPLLVENLRCADVESAEYQVAVEYFRSHPDRITAAILAILLGDFGVQHFYTGQIVRGVLDIIFCWTGIPAIIGLVEGIVWLCESDSAFLSQVEGRR
ncbi:MAG: TM2 domain-containing protein [Bacteroidales bacterium]|nr:TM2 domain-containing protein [Candidatus Colimorpha merdihippi]MCQ2282327.1 TM2 domain-containing protein [Bacteroidales bacterium]